MRLDLTGLLKEKGVGLEYKEKVVVDFPSEELEVAGPVDVDLCFTNTGGGIWMQGDISADIKMPCSRCLRQYCQKVTAKVEERIKKNVELDDEDVVFEIAEDGSADLSEIIRQSLLLNIPIKPVCSAGCKGLLDDAVIGKGPDPRLDKLKEIRCKGEK